MTIRADVRAHLLADAAITALVDVRVTTLPIQEGLPLPIITHSIVGDAPQTNLDGDDGGLNAWRVQLDCWAATSDGADELAELVRIRMQTAAATFRAVPVPGAFTEYEQETKRHRKTRDYSCWHRTG